MEAETGFTITEFKTLPFVYNCANNENITLTMDLQDQSGQIIGTFNAEQVICTGVQGNNGPYDDYYTMSFENDPIIIPSAGRYTLIPKNGNDLIWYSEGANFSSSSYAVPGIVSITSDTRNDRASSFPGIFDLVVSAGNSCDRAVVIANTDCLTNTEEEINTHTSSVEIFPNPVSGMLYISSENEVESVEVMNEVGSVLYQGENAEAVNMSSWKNGLYMVRIKSKYGTTVQKIVKQ